MPASPADPTTLLLSLRADAPGQEQGTRAVAEAAVTDPIRSREASPEFHALFGLVYDELQRIARAKLHGERRNHTLDTSALVHEVYLRLVDQTQLDVRDRSRFFALAARCMRSVLVDYARRRGAQKRGGGAHAVTLEDHHHIETDQTELVLSIDAALDKLAVRHERMARVVECRFFGGLTVAETASALGVSPRTVEGDWTRSKLYLANILGPTAA